MLKISFLELCIRGIPEGFLLVLSIYAFCKEKLNAKRYFISSAILILTTVLIRSLPINYGVHTLLNIIVLIGLSVYINKLSLLKVIKASLLVTMILFFLEACNVAILQLIYHNQLADILGDPSMKAILSFPSTVVFAVVIGVCYHIFVRKKYGDQFKELTEHGTRF